MKPCPDYAYLDSPLVGTENGFTWKQVSIRNDHAEYSYISPGKVLLKLVKF